MANNVNMTQSGTTVVATEDIGGVHHQVVRLTWGESGTATRVSATNPLPVSDKPFAAILYGMVELVDQNHQVDASEYGASVSVASGISGEILSIALYSSEIGSGAVQTPGCTVFFFLSDPSITAGDTTLAAAAADHKLMLGKVKIDAGDWNADANGAVAQKSVSIPFHSGAIYAVIRLDAGATSLNDAGGDDEEIHMGVWIRRDS